MSGAVAAAPTAATTPPQPNLYVALLVSALAGLALGIVVCWRYLRRENDGGCATNTTASAAAKRAALMTSLAEGWTTYCLLLRSIASNTLLQSDTSISSRDGEAAIIRNKALVQALLVSQDAMAKTLVAAAVVPASSATLVSNLMVQQATLPIELLSLRTADSTAEMDVKKRYVQNARALGAAIGGKDAAAALEALANAVMQTFYDVVYASRVSVDAENIERMRALARSAAGVVATGAFKKANNG